jgi:hypothetical protein
VLSGLLELIGNAILTFMIGVIPGRQPWRALVASIYILGALGGVAVLIWAIVVAL